MNKTKNKSIFVLLSYPRSGGTVLSQIMGNSKNTQLFSEINPHYLYHLQLIKQAKDWYQLHLKGNSFQEDILDIVNQSTKETQIILRDFSFINFTPHKQNSFNPSFKFEILSKIPHPFTPFAIIRHPFDIWTSRGCPPFFFEYYLKYLQELKYSNIITFKYEHFCHNPQETFQTLCRETGIELPTYHTNTFILNKQITGDSNVLSRPAHFQTKLALPKRRAILPEELKSLTTNDYYAEACELSAYEIYIPSALRKSTLTFWENKLKYFIGSRPAHCY